MIRSYSGLIRFDTLEERFDYLSLRGEVGQSTFGFDRLINQRFYRSREWRQVRHFVITRDEGCDLGVEGYEIHHQLLIHHMNPMEVKDLVHADTKILDPEYLITTSHQTHNAIHYGDKKLLPRLFVPRSAGDTKLW